MNQILEKFMICESFHFKIGIKRKNEGTARFLDRPRILFNKHKEGKDFQNQNKGELAKVLLR